MKFFISIILIALLSIASCLYLPWYSIAIVSFAVAALVPQKPVVSFLAGFIALFLLWGGLSYYITVNNNDVLAHKVSMLILQMDSPMLLVLITAIVGAVVGGMGALSGSFLRKLNG